MLAGTEANLHAIALQWSPDHMIGETLCEIQRLLGRLLASMEPRPHDRGNVVHNVAEEGAVYALQWSPDHMIGETLNRSGQVGRHSHTLQWSPDHMIGETRVFEVFAGVNLALQWSPDHMIGETHPHRVDRDRGHAASMEPRPHDRGNASNVVTKEDARELQWSPDHMIGETPVTASVDTQNRP